MSIKSSFSSQMELMSQMFEYAGAPSPASLAVSANADFHEASLRCAACGSTRECEEFLAEKVAPTPPPAFCPNHRLIERLANLAK